MEVSEVTIKESHQNYYYCVTQPTGIGMLIRKMERSSRVGMGDEF